VSGGVADGTRTHDDQNHNLGLYQLSYSHRREPKLYGSDQLLGADAAAAATASSFTSAL
jgi:hypothetical protein